MKTKGIELNGYTLSERVRAKMILTLFKTHQKKKELGFTLCSNPDNIITAGGEGKGYPNKIEIDPRLCDTDEKFIGGYHTHFDQDSYPSAEDLHYCGVFKTTCSGGNDNKIRCNTFNGEQESVEEYNKTVLDIHKGEIKAKNSRYQKNFDCIRVMNPLFLEEKDIKEEAKDLYGKLLHLDDMKRRGDPERVIIETENRIITDLDNIDRSVRELVEKIRNESKKYYNEVEII